MKNILIIISFMTISSTGFSADLESAQSGNLKVDVRSCVVDAIQFPNEQGGLPYVAAGCSVSCRSDQNAHCTSAYGGRVVWPATCTCK